MHKAKLETSNFTFEAYHRSKEAARGILCVGLRKHCEEYGTDYAQFIETFGDDISVEQIQVGRAYRDGMRL